MLNHTIIITASPLSSANSQEAFNCVNALLDEGHRIQCIFFWQDGAYTGLLANEYPSDEYNPYQAWRELQSQQKIALEICTTSLARRGLNSTDVHDAFKISTLAQLTEHMLKSDNTLTFQESK